jgi:hypothetical protein
MSDTSTKQHGFLCALALACGLPFFTTASSYALPAVGSVPGAPVAQNDASGGVDKTGENHGRGAARPGQQPAAPLPVSPSSSSSGNPSQAPNNLEAGRAVAGACDSGESSQCYALGVLEQDSGHLAEARRLFAKACDGGDMRGCNNLGLLEKQSGHLAESSQLFAKACDGGDMRGCNNLGFLEKQSGNVATAKRLYLKACGGHDMSACANLAALERQSGNLAEAKRLFALACNGGEALACSGPNALKGRGKAREQQVRQGENEEETEPYDNLEKPSDPDALPPEHGHLGLGASLLKASSGNGLGHGLELRGGWRPLPSAEIGILVGAWLDGSTVVAIPVLFQFNGIVPVNTVASFYGGGQLGLVHYRLDRSIYEGSIGGGNNRTVGIDAFAFGLQAGISVRVASSFSFRLELAWLHADSASTTSSSSGYSSDTYSIEANDFVHANLMFCLTF